MKEPAPEPAISIIVPVYNVEKYLPRCLESLLGQTLRQIEILCVDDGSTDGSSALLQAYAARDPRIRLFRQPNRRPGGARNTGLDAAWGAYVLYVDADDRIDADACELLYAAAQRHRADVACASVRKCYLSGRVKWLEQYAEETIFASVGERFRAVNCPPNFLVTGKLYRREKLLGLGVRFPENCQHEDVYYLPQVLAGVEWLVTVPGPVYHYVVRRGSLMKSRQSARQQREKYKAHRFFIAYADRIGLPLAPAQRTVTKRCWSLGGWVLLRIRECDGRRTWRLFDLLPVWRSR